MVIRTMQDLSINTFLQSSTPVMVNLLMSKLDVCEDGARY